MSSFGADEVGAKELTQDIREQRIVDRFDYFTTRGGPQRGAVILRFLGFGVITLVGIDPEVARIGDVAVEVAHNGFHTRAEVTTRNSVICIHHVCNWDATAGRMQLSLVFYATTMDFCPLFGCVCNYGATMITFIPTFG